MNEGSHETEIENEKIVFVSSRSVYFFFRIRIWSNVSYIYVRSGVTCRWYLWFTSRPREK
jgi:hypothetical protein